MNFKLHHPEILDLILTSYFEHDCHEIHKIYCATYDCAYSYLGCEDFDTLTKDPNQPTDVHPSLLLTSIEVTVFNQVSVGAAYACRYLVFTDGYSTDQTYGWQRSGFGGYNTLLQVYKMNQEAEKRNLRITRHWQNFSGHINLPNSP